MIATETDLNPQKASHSNLERWRTLATGGLRQMLDPDQQLFCYRMVKTPQGLRREGISRRYTLITLMGLHRLERSGGASPIPLQPILEGLLADTSWVDNLGDLGLLLWLCALAVPDRCAQVADRLAIRHALLRYPDAQQARTMELAWFLTGLCHWALALPAEGEMLTGIAFEARRRLHRNLAACAVFPHMARGTTLAGRLRWWAGSFADQVYPIYAFTKFAQAWSSPVAQRLALDCARAICRAQGARGQWWWHYDASNAGRVEIVDAYPVFSVHQHGMAPMVLFEAGEAFQQDFTPWIYKGLDWIDANNELHFPMADGSLIWRGIERASYRRYWDALFNRPAAGEERSAKDLRVIFECRPYELGWLLYAWAGRA